MSHYDDYDKGYRGDYSPDSYSNLDYMAGAAAAQQKKASEDWIDSLNATNASNQNSSYSGGYSSTPMSPSAARVVVKVFLAMFILMLLLFAVGAVFATYQQSVISNALTAKKEKAQAAVAAQKVKWLTNRQPFTFNGYTLYSAPNAQSHFLSFKLTNAAGKVIWTQPAWMHDAMVSESKPMADIAAKYYLHPGRTHFIISGTGPKNQFYMEFMSISRHGQVTRFSWQHPPYKYAVKNVKPFHFSAPTA